MYAERLLRKLGRTLDRVWPLQALGRQVYRWEFGANRDRNLFQGEFADFEAAAASAPSTRPVGYDNEESADLYSDERRLQDYAAVFWLERAFGSGCRRVFDLGGHTGMKFYAFSALGAIPGDVRWTVCDVPAVVQAGRRRAFREAAEERLFFTSERDAVVEADVLYSSGAFQYLDESPGALLRRTGARPRWVVMNGVPIHASRNFVTLNSIGTAFCPYRVQSKASLLGELEALGYRERDAWHNAAKSLQVPFHPELEVPAYSGFCFERFQDA